MTRRKGEFLTLVPTIITLVSLTFMGGFAVRAIFHWQVSNQLREEIARIENVSEPLTYADLYGIDHLKFAFSGNELLRNDDPNDAGHRYGAAIHLLAAGPVYEVQRRFSDYLDMPPGKRAPSVVDEIAQFLDRNVTAALLLDEAAAMNECQFGRGSIDWNSPGGHGFAEIRALAVFQSLRTRYYVALGDADNAARAAYVALRIGRILEGHDGIMSRVVRSACTTLPVSDLELVLGMKVSDDGMLRKLQDTLESEACAEQLRKCILTDRVEWLRRADDLLPADLCAKLSAGNSGAPRPDSGYDFTVENRRKIVTLLRYLAEVLETAQTPWPAPVFETKRIAEAYADGPAAEIILPFDTLSSNLAREAALVRSIRTAVFIERYRLRHDRLPDSLGELAEEFDEDTPVDPFTTDRPLCYLLDSKGYTVYSVGVDQNDNMGDIRDPMREDHDPTDTGVRIRFQTD